MATNAALCVRELISHPAAIIIMKVPVFEKRLPPQRFRKCFSLRRAEPEDEVFSVTEGALRKPPRETKIFYSNKVASIRF
jgi:hypothetical protein